MVPDENITGGSDPERESSYEKGIPQEKLDEVLAEYFQKVKIPESIKRYQVRRMQPEDIPAVGVAYNSALLPVELFVELHRKNESAVVEILAKQRGGMVNIFNVEPVQVEEPGVALSKRLPSVEEEMNEWIPAGFEVPKRSSGMKPGSYRGKILTAVDRPEEILAWTTYLVSNRSPSKRSAENDESVAQVERILLEDIQQYDVNLDAESTGLLRKSARVAFIDTLWSRGAGAGISVTLSMLQELEENGYEDILVWRTKMIELLSKTGVRMGERIPLGNNWSSEDYNTRIGVKDIGTQMSPHAAVRGKAAGEDVVETYYAQQKRAWMTGKIKTLISVLQGKLR